ncbi:MAG: hypothetical protein ABJC10_12745, partial [Acidobacteriota bacterium]
MNRKTASLIALACFFVSCLPAISLAQTQPGARTTARTLQTLVDEAARKTLDKFADKKLEE